MIHATLEAARWCHHALAAKTIAGANRPRRRYDSCMLSCGGWRWSGVGRVLEQEPAEQYGVYVRASTK